MIHGHIHLYDNREERVSKYDKGYIAEDISAESMFEYIMKFYNSKIGNN